MLELTINNYHIFDERIVDKFKEMIENNINYFEENKSYIFEINYKADTVLDEEDFDFEHSIYNKVKLKFKDDKRKSTALSSQLNNCLEILKKNNIECYDGAIIGMKLDSNVITFEVREDLNKDIYPQRRKNKKRLTMHTIMPNFEFVFDTLEKYHNELMNDIFEALYKSINCNNKILCAILDMNYTDDLDDIFKEFCNQYGDFMLSDQDGCKKIKEKLLNRARSVLDSANK